MHSLLKLSFLKKFFSTTVLLPKVPKKKLKWLVLGCSILNEAFADSNCLCNFVKIEFYLSPKVL